MVDEFEVYFANNGVGYLIRIPTRKLLLKLFNAIVQIMPNIQLWATTEKMEITY
jgi:hypothetical protein